MLLPYADLIIQLNHQNAAAHTGIMCLEPPIGALTWLETTLSLWPQALQGPPRRNDPPGQQDSLAVESCPPLVCHREVSGTACQGAWNMLPEGLEDLRADMPMG